MPIDRTRHSDSSEVERLRGELKRAKARAQQAEKRANEAEAAADHQSQVARRKYQMFQVWVRVLDTVRWVPVVAATWIPFHALEPIARDFAGKSTHLDATLTISVAFSVAVSVSWVYTATQSRLRKNKIKRQRERLKSLEAEAEDLRRRLSQYEAIGTSPTPRQRPVGEEG